MSDTSIGTSPKTSDERGLTKGISGGTAVAFCNGISNVCRFSGEKECTAVCFRHWVLWLKQVRKPSFVVITVCRIDREWKDRTFSGRLATCKVKIAAQVRLDKD
mmetsp:Transcript_10501/g.23182  ORF Transcript_10501/g.23182 Transcript_10501/m.23182 type:complete len:104 (-) Transcript_10501:61-372(-)